VQADRVQADRAGACRVRAAEAEAWGKERADRPLFFLPVGQCVEAGRDQNYFAQTEKNVAKIFYIV